MTEEEKKAQEAAEKAEKERLEKERLEKEKAEKEKDKLYSESYVKGLRDEAAKWRTQLRAAEEKLGKLDSVDMEEYQQLKQKAKEAEQKELETKGEWDKAKQIIMDNHAKELAKKDEAIAKKDTEIAKLQAELNNTILENAVAIEASAAKCVNPMLLSLWMGREARVVTLDDERRVVKLFNEDGTHRLNSKGDPMTIKERLEEMKQDPQFAVLFEGGVAGAGSKTERGGSGKQVNPWKKETLNLTEQGRIVRENPELAKRLATEAGAVLYTG